MYLKNWLSSTSFVTATNQAWLIWCSKDSTFYASKLVYWIQPQSLICCIKTDRFDGIETIQFNQSDHLALIKFISCIDSGKFDLSNPINVMLCHGLRYSIVDLGQTTLKYDLLWYMYTTRIQETIVVLAALFCIIICMRCFPCFLWPLPWLTYRRIFVLMVFILLCLLHLKFCWIKWVWCNLNPPILSRSQKNY